MKYFDRVYVETPTTGTGTISLGSALSGNWMTPAEAGAASGDVATFIIEEGADFEIVTGVFGADALSITRATVLKSKIGGSVGTAKMELSGSATVFFDVIAWAMNDLEARSGFLQKRPEVVKTDNYTLTAADAGKAIIFNKSTAITAALPAVAGSASEIYLLRCLGAGSLTIDPNSTETIEGASTMVLTQGFAAMIWPNEGKTAWRATVMPVAASANVQALLKAANYAAIRTLLGLDGVVEEMVDSTGGSEDSAIVFKPFVGGTRKEIGRYHVMADGKPRYLFMDIDAWEAAHPGNDYPSADGVNEFHFTATEGPSAESGMVTAEFEALAGSLRVAIEAPATEDVYFSFEHDAPKYSLGLIADDANDKLRLRTGALMTGSEVMVWDRVTGRVSIGTDNYLVSTNETLTVNGMGWFQRASGNPLSVNRLTDDGPLVYFFQDGTLEGTISVAGTTVSYGSFIGSHWSQFLDAGKPDMLVGTVIETIDDMCEWLVEVYEETVTEARRPKMKTVERIASRVREIDGEARLVGDVETVEVPVTERVPLMRDGVQVTKAKRDGKGNVIGREPMFINRTVFEEQGTRTETRRVPYDPAVGLQHGGRIEKETNIQLARCKVSDTPGSPAVYGVFRAWDDGDLDIASLGAFVIRIGKGVKVKRGDLLESAGDGTARPQKDDVIRSRTIAKVTAAVAQETYPDGSYLVPCTLHCG